MLGTTILEEKESKYNSNLRVVKTFGIGNYIQAGGITQSGGIVESIWKSTLKKIKDVKNNILVLGLGGGTLAKLLRKKFPESKIDGYEIDPMMIEFGKKYLKLDDFGIDIKIKDVNKVKFKNDYYDLIIIDMYQGTNFPKEFESEVFIKKIKLSMADNGTLIINRLYYGEKRPDTVRFGNKLEKIFKNVVWHYPEANLMFICNK